MTSVRRQIYLSKVVADRWVVIGGFTDWGKSRMKGQLRWDVGITPLPKVTMILTVVSDLKSIKCSVNHGGERFILWGLRSKVMYT